jgi:quinol-cytochrome oxidoreductase complex cytochrome b subunit
LINQWMKKQEDSEICTEKKYDETTSFNVLAFFPNSVLYVFSILIDFVSEIFCAFAYAACISKSRCSLWRFRNFAFVRFL